MNKIIIIEDDDDAWYLMKNLLTHIGYKSDQLIRYASLAEIRPAMQPVEIVLTDLNLPDSRGIQTFVRVCRAFKQVPIIAITGDAGHTTGIDVIKAGAQDYLVKGEIDERILAKSIQYAIERKKTATDYHRIFMHNPTPMYVLDEETLDILAVNDASIEKYGYSRQEFLKLKGTDIRPPEETERFKQHVRTSTEDQYDAGMWWHRKKDGAIFAVHVFVHHTEFQGREARMVVAIDIDKERKAEIALAREEQNLRAIINNTDDIIWSIDRNNQIISANHAFWKVLHAMTGKKEGEITEADFENGLFSSWTHFFARAFRGEAFKTLWANHFTGVESYSEISFNPITDDGGEIIGVSCFSRDVTATISHQRKIERQNVQLREIAWIQSHKVRNHVATILGLTHLLNVEGELNETNQKAIDGIKVSAESLDEVIHEINKKTEEIEDNSNPH